MVLTVEQLIAVCKDLQSTLDICRSTIEQLGMRRARTALMYRYAYLRDIRKLLEE